MSDRKIADLELKIKYTKEYLENGGLEKIYFPDILEDLLTIKFGPDGMVDPESVNPGANSFMMALLASHKLPPLYHPEHISNYASLLQKANCFDQICIDTSNQFDEIYLKYSTKTNMLFRGQREAKWRLYSRLQRAWIYEKLVNSGHTYNCLIGDLVKIGQRKFEELIKEISNSYNVDSLNSISVLGFLQHHGCPTPLLDWSYKFQNALYFGIDGLEKSKSSCEIDNYFSVYFIEEQHFGEGNMRLLIEEALIESEKSMLHEVISEIAEDESTKRRMEERFSGRRIIDRKKISGSGLISHMTKVENLLHIPQAYFSDNDVKSGILFSLNNSKNIVNQAGVFTWNSDPSKPLEMVGEEQFGLKHSLKEFDFKFCSCLNIHKNLAEEIKDRLVSEGITREFIYPLTSTNAYSVFIEAIESVKANKKTAKKKRRKKLRNNEQLVEYWKKRKKSKKTRIRRH